MSYQSPGLDALLNGVAEVEAAYHKNNFNHNPDRVRLLEILKAVRDLIWRQSQLGPITDLQRAEWQKIIEGAYFCCIARADKDSSFLGRSSLRDLLMEKAKLSATNVPTDGEKMNRSVKFYNFLRLNEAALNKVFHKHALNAKLKNEDRLCARKLSAEVIGPMTLFFDSIKQQAEALAHGVPTEIAIDSTAPNVFLDYVNALEKAGRTPDNQDRLFTAQLIAAFCSTCKPDKENDAKFLARSHLAKLGALVWGRESIDETYWVLSPSRSELYRICDERVNRLHGSLKADALATFETFLMDKETKAQIEAFGRAHFKEKSLLNNLDAKIRPIPATIDRLMDSYRSKSLAGPTIMTAATIFALISSVPGQAVGMTLGTAIGEMDHMVHLKMGIGRVASSIMQHTCGQGASMGYKIADLIVNSTTAGVMGILFQMGAFAIGGLTGAGLASLFIVLPAMGFSKLPLSDFWKQMDTTNPTLAKEVDREFIEAILSLPPELFKHGKEDLKRIQYVTRGRLANDVGLFAKAPIANPAVANDAAAAANKDEKPAGLQMLVSI